MTVPSIASNEVCLKLANNFGNRNLLLADVADFFFADCGSGRTLERPPRRRRRWTESATGSAAPPPRSPNHSTAAPRVRLIRAESSCARGAPRQAPSVRQRHPHSGGQQSDPRSDRPDPLEPAGRRFADFVFAIFRFGANAGARAFAANDRSCGRRGAGRALRGTGSWKTRGIERSAFDTRYSASGRPLELGRSGRTIDHAAAAAPGARCEVRGHGKHAALKDQRLIASRLTFLIDFVRSKASWFSQHAAAPAAWRNSPPCRQGPSWARGVSRSDNAERIRYLRGRSVPRIGARHPPLALRQFRWAMA